MVIVGALFVLLALPAISSARDLYFGINANTRNTGASEQTVAAETGVNRLREDLEWNRIEPKQGEWIWSGVDQMYTTAAERGMTILPVPTGSPCWAVPAEIEDEDECERTMPVANSDYAELVAQAAERYGPGGTFWEGHPGLDSNLASRYIEIWNESYLGRNWPLGSEPERYADLYKAAVTAGRAANPSTRYLIESAVDSITSHEPFKFVHWAQAMVEEQPTIGNYIDGIAVHPYPETRDPYEEPENGTDASFKNTNVNYEKWKQVGIDKPVWITEVGYSSCTNAGRCVSGETQAKREQRKAEWLTDLLDELGEDEYAFVHAVYLYNLRQFEGSSPADFSSWLGIINDEDEHLPAWNSFATAVEEYDGVPVPNTTITKQTISAGSATFDFTVNDETSSLDCQLDGGTWTPCTSPKSYSGLAAGGHTFKVRATNAEATESNPASYSWSVILPPAATTEAATSVAETSATLNGTVNPQAGAATYYFEYGTTTSYGTKIPASPKSAGSGTSAVSVSESATGLLAGTLYHYRIVATNSAGTTKGADKTLSTRSSVAAAVAAVPVVDPLNRTEATLSNGGKWLPLSWAGGTVKAGHDATSGWGPANAFPNIQGAYWDPIQASDAGGGDASGLVLNLSPDNPERYISIWLNMPNPASVKSGYQLSWTLTAVDTYSVKISKWVAGTETVLASSSSVSIPPGTRMMISDSGDTLTAWKGTGGSISTLLTAGDSTYSGGFAGIEGSGNRSHSIEFRDGSYSSAKIVGLPVLDSLQRGEVPLATGKWTKPTWATSIGGAWNSGPWLGYGTSGLVVSAAYWNPTTFNDSVGGDGVAATMTAAPSSEQYLSIWLDMPSPGSAQSGYEARWTRSATNYTLQLAKSTSGTRTVLASRAEIALPIGTTVGLTEKGGNLIVWTGTGALTPTLMADDSSYTSGYAGMQVYGGAPTMDNFQAGALK